MLFLIQSGKSRLWFPDCEILYVLNLAEDGTQSVRLFLIQSGKNGLLLFRESEILNVLILEEDDTHAIKVSGSFSKKAGKAGCFCRVRVTRKVLWFLNLT
jgi:hypothetical protein